MRVVAFAAFAAVLMAASASAAVITGIEPMAGGVNGETRVTVTGTGFDIRGRSNDVFIGTGLNGVFCDPVPNECTDTRIVCLTDKFQGGPPLPLSVRSFGFVADCQVSGGCTFQYTYDKTPEVTSITPEWVVAEDVVTVTGSRFTQGDVTVGAFDFTTHLGEEERCELVGTISASAYQCRIHSMRPGALPVDVIMGASGRATLGGARTITLYPQLQRVAPAVGSLRGGTTLTLTGTAWSPDAVENRVTVHGRPCVVTSVAEDRLECITSGNPVATSVPARSWADGKAKLDIWYDLPGSDIENLVSKLQYHQVSETRMVDGLTIGSLYCTNCAARLTTHFVAPATGNFTFTASGDDEWEIWVAQDANPIVRRQELPANSSNVLDVTPYHRLRCGRGVYSTPANGCTRMLTAGAKYWFRAWLKQGSGGMGLDMQVRDAAGAVVSTVATTSYSADWVPPVAVTVRDTPALLGDDCLNWGTCNFDYSTAATPSVTAVTATATPGASITIDGAMFDTSASKPAAPATCADLPQCGGGGCACATNAECSNYDDLCTWDTTTGKCRPTATPPCDTWSRNVVTVGGAECQVTSQTATRLVCRLGYTAGAGSFPVVVQAGALGLAAGSPLVTVTASIRKIVPAAGSINGGNILTVLGHGFDKEDGVTSVEVGGAACNIVSIMSYVIECVVPAGTVGATSVVVKTQSRVADSAAYAYTYSDPITRPGVTQTGGEPSVYPRRASLGGGTSIRLEVPSVAISATTATWVRFGDVPCDISFALGSFITCRTRGVNAPRVASGVVNVTYANGATASVTVPSISYVRSVTTVYDPIASVSGSTTVDIRYDGYPVPPSAVSVRAFGAPCMEESHSAGRVICTVGPKPATEPVLPIIEALDFTVPEGSFTNPLNRMDYSTGVAAQADGSVTIPPGANWLMTKRQVPRPFVFRAKVRTTTDVASSSAAVTMRVCVTENSLSTSGYRARVSDTSDGRFAIRGADFTSRPSNVQYAAGTSFASIGLDSTAYRDYKMVVGRRYIRFYIDNVLIHTVEHAGEQVGSVGFGHSGQAIRVRDLVIEDLYPQSLQVNVSGVPLWSVSDVIWANGPVITRFKPTDIAVGTVLTVFGDAFQESPYEVFALPSADADITSQTPRVCSGSLTTTPAGQQYFTCTVGPDALAGNTVLSFRGGRGKAAFTSAATVQAVVAAVSPTFGGPAGGLVTLTGGGFARDSAVTIGGAACPILTMNSQRIVCMAPAGTGNTRAIAITSGGRAGAVCGSCTYSYNETAAQVTAISATSGGEGTSVTFTGTNFETSSDSWVRFGTTGCSIWRRTATEIRCTVGRATATGAQPIVVHFPRSGKATFADGVATDFTFQTIATSLSPSTGSVNGGQTVRVSGSNIDTAAGVTRVASHTYTAVESPAWTNAPAGLWTTCNGLSMLGPITYQTISKTLTGLAAHQGLRVAYDMTQTSADVVIAVDGKEFAVPRTSCDFGWACGATWASTCRATGSVVFAHTATTAKIEFRTRSSNGWGLISYDIGTVAAIAQTVTIGGSACAVTLVEPSGITCRTPAGTGTATVVVSAGGATLCSGCQYTFASTSTPTVALAAAAEFPGLPTDAAARAMIPQLAVASGVAVTYSATGARVWKRAGQSDSWNGLASSPQAIAMPTSGVDGIAFVAVGTCAQMWGLSSTQVDASGSYTSIDFAIYLESGSSVTIYESGTNRGTVSSYVAGDSFSVYYDSACSCVKYAQNGVVLFQTDSQARFPLYMAGSVYNSYCGGIDHLKYLQARPQTSRIVATGTGFAAAAGAAVSIGGAACVDSYVSTNVANCWVATLPTGSFNIAVNGANGDGSSASIGLTAATFSRTSDSTGSTRGGHEVTILGTGFDGTTTVTIGSQCTVIARTATSLTCVTSANAAGTQPIVVMTGATTHTCIPYMGLVGSSSATCDYTYSAPAGAVTGITGTTTSGASINVTGTGFPSGSVVYLGSYKCATTRFTSTLITCTIPWMPADTYSVRVVDQWSGDAASSVTATLPLTVTSISTQAIGNTGGAKIVISGANFGVDGQANVAVTAGATNACASIQRSYNRIVCTTAAFDYASGALTLSVGSVNAVAAASFSSSAAAVPTVTAVVPTSGGAGAAVTVQGTNLEGTGVIVVGGVECAVYWSDASSAACILASGAPSGNQAVTVRTDNRGTGTGSASFNVRLMVASVTPPRGTNAGGVLATIVGSGFSTDASRMRVRIAGVACAVQTATATTLTCLTGMAPNDNSRNDVSVAVINASAVTATTAAAQYTFDTALTATIAAITPTSASAAGMEMFTITGTGFSTDALMNTVMIGNVACPVQSASATTLVCMSDVMPIAAAAPVNVVVNQQGRATQPATPVTIAVSFNINSVSGGSFSVEGGAIVTFTGTGFWTFDSASWMHSYYKLTVGGQDCAITQATATTIMCRLPASKRPFVKLAPLVNAYTLKPDAANQAVTLTANGKTAVVNAAAVVNYAQADTPRVTAVSPKGTVAPGTSITVTGTGFAASGNTVLIGDINCPVTSESATQVVCTVAADSLGSGFLRVNVPGKGYSSSALSCPAGQYLMCDGKCVADSQCIKEEWGMASCASLSNLIIGDTFCHANGGTDRVGIPFKTDSNTVFNLNCPMYSCEGGDCDQALYIGGRGGRVSTCGPDPAGEIIDIRPAVTTVSTTTSSIGGGRVITIGGSSFGTNATAVVVTANGAVCAVTSVTATQIVCETSAQVRSTSALMVYVRGVAATCDTNTCRFMYVDSGIPEVSAVSPTNPRAAGALTITGAGFAATGMTVYIGSRVCAVTSSTTTTIVCTAPQMPVGTHALRVVNAAIGSSYGATVTYRLYVSGISATTGSVEGGHVVSITGTGFSAATQARFGSCATEFVSVTNDKLVVRTGNCSAGQQTVVAFQGTSTSSCDGTCPRYTFAAGATPEISAANINGNTVVLTVSNLNGAAQTDVTVTAGMATCAITAFSATSITCTMGANHGGTYRITLLTANQGMGPTRAASNPTFTWTTTVSAVAPASGARGGGQSVTIDGANFGTSAANLVAKLGTSVCAITSVTDTRIVCTSAQTTQSGVVDVTVLPVNAKMVNPVAAAVLAASYTFTANSPTITSVTPNRGSTAGGTSLTIGGTDLTTSLVITIDGIVCTQSTAQQTASTATILYCTTQAHHTLLEPVLLQAALPSNGGRAFVTATYQYIDLWSRWTTWGNTPPPVEGDSAVISEGQAVMIDYSPPRFFLIVVMGHLMFDHNIDINLDCTYIMINFGRFTVGTPERPYLKKAVITLHGDRLTPEIPVHGAKVIALRHGALDMHGEPRQKTWTRLAATAAAGASTIQVRGPVDWRVGEFIVVAPTDYEFLDAEHRMITGVTPADGQAAVVTIQLEFPLRVMHFGERQCFGTAPDQVCVDEIAEVGLLTRNIVVRGDKNSMRIGFGGTMFLMPLGHDENMYARLSYVEFAQCGQQFIVGRYPVHYHVTHTASNSYVNGTSVHESLNRAFSIHGVHNNTYVNNVAYDILGHAFFIEDGSERYNLIENNMVSVVKSTTSNLNTDVTPANFWVVSVTNMIRNNAACGGHAYGFWISPFHPHSTGPTHSTSDCPASHQLADFSGNVAHSNRKYGLNIFQYWWPKAVECDFNSADVPAYIRNHLSYKNHIHGITMGNQEAGQVGSIIIDNYTAADNGWVHKDASAYWIEKNSCRNMTIGIQNSRLIALTNNNRFNRQIARRAINLPEGDNFFTENVTFVNYDNENFGFEPQAWAERMSLCFPWGWEAVSRGLKWIDSPQRVRMRFHHHGVLNDDDGTLSDMAGSQVVAKSPIFDDTICTTVAGNPRYLSEALVCPNHYKIRRFGISTMNEIWTWQRWINGQRSEEVPEILRKYLMTAPINHSIRIDFQWWKNPALWDWRFGAFKFLQPGERMRFTTIYNETRHHVYGTFNTRALNKTWDRPEPQLSDARSGYSFNNVTMQYTGLMVYPDVSAMSVAAFNCPDEGCPLPPLAPGAWDQPCRSFTAPSSWNGNAVPRNGSALFISSTESVCMDGLASTGARRQATPTTTIDFPGTCAAGQVFRYHFFSLRIEGSLQLLDHHCPCAGAIVHLTVESNVWIRNGGLMVGNSTNPLTRCQFRLSVGAPPFGDVTRMANYRLDPWGVRSVTIESGMLRLIGAKPQPLWARLSQTANAGTSTITLDQPVTWAADTEIAIAGTNRMTMYHEARQTEGDEFEQSEKRVVQSVSADGRTVTLRTPLAFTHYGATPRTLGDRTYNVGAEVIALNRNIILDGGESGRAEPAYNAGWKLNVGCTENNAEGCAIGVDGEVGWPMRGVDKPGFIQVDGTLFRDMGQAADQHGSIDIDGLVDREDASGSFFRNNAFDRMYNTGIFIRDTTRGMSIVNNTFFNVSGDAIRVAVGGNTIDGNVIIRLNMPIQICDFVYFIFWDCRTAGVRAHAGNRVVNNVVASGRTAGYITEGDLCTAGSMQWANNYVHSTRDGMLVADLPAETNMNWADDATVPTTCRHVGGVTAYWIGDQGLMNWYASGDFMVSNLTVVEATVGLAGILMYPPANIQGQTVPTATYTNLAFAGFWDGQSCRSTEHYWKCKKSLLDSKPWCEFFHLGHNQQKMGVTGLVETVFTSSEFGGHRTKGEQKFRFLESDSYTTVGGQVKVNGIHFANFDGNDACGLKNVAFHQNPYSNDTFHHHEFRRVTWGGLIEDGGEIYTRTMYGDANHPADPFTPTWYLDYDNFKYGAYWPDAPNHIMIKDLDGSFTRTGRRTTIVASQSLVRNDVFSKYGYDGRAFRAGNLGAPRSACVEKSAWRAFQCDDSIEFLTVAIDNLAEDRLTRRPGPVVLCKGDGMIDVNGWPLCQGGNVQYSSGPVMKGKEQRATLERMTRYWFHAENRGNHTLSFRGQPPENMRFYLQDHEYLGLGNNVGVTLNLRFHGLNSQLRVGVYVNGVRQRPVVGYGYPREQTPAMTWPASTDPAGTHYHDKYVNAQQYTSLGNQGVQRNVLSFVLRPGSVVDLRAEPIVQVSATLSMPVDEFFNNKDTFVAALASTLGIDADRIKFAKIVPGTTRRRQSTGTTSVGVDIGMTDAQASQYTAGGSLSDLSNVATAVNGLRNSSNPIPGFAVQSISASVAKVEIPVPPVNIVPGTPYILLNVSRASMPVNSTLVHDALVTYAKTSMNVTVAPAFNLTTPTEVAITNVYDDTNRGLTRAAILMLYENATQSYVGLEHIYNMLNNASTRGAVLPGYTIHSVQFSGNGFGSGASGSSSDDFWSVNGSVLKFAVGVAVGLLLIAAIGGIILYCIIKKNTAKALAREQEAAKRGAEVPTGVMSPDGSYDDYPKKSAEPIDDDASRHM